MNNCSIPGDKDKIINPGAIVRISENAEEDSPDTQDETLVKSEHAGEEGKYVDDIVTQCKVRFAIIELEDGTRVPIRKQYIEPL